MTEYRMENGEKALRWQELEKHCIYPWPKNKWANTRKKFIECTYSYVKDRFSIGMQSFETGMF